MKNFILLLSMVFCLLISIASADAQVRKKTTSKKSKKEKEKTEQVSLMEKINPEIRFGNLGFFNGLTISTKANVGYKLSERFTAGAGLKLFYNQFSVQGPDPSIFDLGGFLYARGKITNQIYLQAEYAFMGYAKDPDPYQIRYITQDTKVNYPLIGLGYTSGFGKWKFGIELLYIANQQAQDIQSSVVEYWFGASYNF
ncbi:MAG: hypothetical protein IPN89_09940 [Saprospiraceae bacterium]|nr:hypothetical protein [Saprospiraceae bacterium]MBL0100058.1 hypothetical protein [Saprospiraceae bacterium]